MGGAKGGWAKFDSREAKAREIHTIIMIIIIIKARARNLDFNRIRGCARKLVRRPGRRGLLRYVASPRIGHGQSKAEGDRDFRLRLELFSQLWTIPCSIYGETSWRDVNVIRRLIHLRMRII